MKTRTVESRGPRVEGQRIPAKTGRLKSDEVNHIAGLLRNRVITLQEAAESAMAIHVKRANRWRDGLNPLRGLNMLRAVSLLEAGERGEYADLQWTYRFIEKRDATLRGLKRRTLGALKRLDWDIKTVPEEKLPPGATKAQADAQAVTLREAYDAIDNLRQAITFIALAEFRGYSHLEPHINADGDPFHLNPVEQWYWCREGLNAPWQYNREAKGGTSKGEPIGDRWFIIYEVEDPVDEIALIAFIRKNLSQKDWDGFIEVFGIPWLFIIGPPNVPKEKEADYQDVAEQIVGDGRGYLPNGSEVKTAPSDSRATNPFRDHLSYQDEQIVLAGTSGKLTMLTESGSGTLAGEAHTDTWQEVYQGMAADVSEVFQQQFDLRILRQHHEGEPVLAYFCLEAKDEIDTSQVVEDAQKLSQGGYQIDADELSEKTGYTLTVKQEAAGVNVGAGSIPRPVYNRKPSPQFLQAARQLFATAATEDLAPVRARIRTIYAMENPDAAKAALAELRTDLPEILRAINAKPATATALFEIIGTALLNGAAERKEAKQ